MPRNGSGTYSLPAGNPVVAGTTIEASWANTTLNDVATEMTGSLARSGSGGMTGPLRLDAGTAAVPALAWSTETTTGLYRAGTNDVRLAVATSDVMRWQAAGVSVTGTLGVSGVVTLSGGTANGVLYLDGSQVATSGSALTFDGTNLGVGTTSPGVKLDVSGADGVRARVVALSGGTPGLILSSAGNTAYTIKAGNADNSLRIDRDGTDRLTLDASGNLGLGVTPSAWSGFKALELNDGYYAASANGPYIGRNSYWNGSNWIYKATSTATQYLQVLGAHLWNIAPSGTAGNVITFTEGMRLDSTGLGIGTASPQYKLDVNGQIRQVQTLAAAYTSQILENSSATGFAQVLFNVGGNGANGQAAVSYAPGIFFALGPSANDTTTPIVFRNNNGTTRATLDASGNLGLGVVPSAWGATRKALQIAGNGALYYDNGTFATYLSNNIYDNGTNNIYIGTGFATRYQQVSGQHIWSTAPSGTAGNTITFTQAMTLDASGNLGLNTSTFGTSAAGVLSLGTGTAPTTGPADTVQIFSVDRSAGNTIPAIRCEGSGVTNAGITSTTVTHKIAMQVNGTIYYLLATTNAT